MNDDGNNRMKMGTNIGVISDTHGLLRPEVFKIFKNVDLILHAGDIGRPEVLEELAKIAPIVAVRGNNDTDPWAKRIPEFKTVSASGVSLFLLHDLKQLPEGVTSGVKAVISGHSHKPALERRDGILFLNPGSAGPRRFKLPIGVARLTVNRARVTARLIEIRT
jgi:putative phosphoesterase